MVGRHNNRDPKTLQRGTHCNRGNVIIREMLIQLILRYLKILCLFFELAPIFVKKFCGSHFILGTFATWTVVQSQDDLFSIFSSFFIMNQNHFFWTYKLFWWRSRCWRCRHRRWSCRSCHCFDLIWWCSCSRNWKQLTFLTLYGYLNGEYYVIRKLFNYYILLR